MIVASILPLTDVWSHLLTSLTFIILFTLPAFRFRRIILIIAVVISFFAFITLEPADPGPASRLRYAASSMWTTYLVWLALMLFHRPEHDFWRVGKAAHEAATMSFGWEKLRWTLNLLSSWRGVGWNVRIPNLPQQHQNAGRWRFVFGELASAIAYYTLVDITTTFLSMHSLDHADETMDQLGLGLRITLAAALGLTIWSYMQLQNAIWSALLVATGMSEKEDFVPLFGPLTAATSLSEFWGTFWHQNLRHTLFDYGQAAARFFHAPRQSVISWLIHVWVAFLVSGLMHSLPFLQIAYISPDAGRLSGFASMMTFYLLQAVGLTIEAAFLVSPGEDVLLYEIGGEDVWYLGRLWTFSWLLFSGQFALECWLRVDPEAVMVPYSLVAKAFPGLHELLNVR